MIDETKGDGMTLDKLRDKVAELVGSVACNGSLMQWAVLEINSSIDAHLAAQSAMRVDEAKLAEAVACVETHLSRMNRYYHEKVAWQVIKDHLAAIGGKS